MANLLLNGSFETGTFANWTNVQTQNTNIGTPGYNSTYCVNIGNFSSLSNLCSQTINTVIGNKYNLTYYLQSPNSFNFQFDARINGVIIPTSVINTNSSFSWRLYSFDFFATSSTTIISFDSLVSIIYPTFVNFDNVSVTSYLTLPCFKEGTQILTDQGYKAIEDLQKGDLVKTLKHGFLPIVILGKSQMVHQASKERVKDQLYECTKENYPDVLEPLIITGCHSILAEWLCQEQFDKIMEDFGRIYETDGKPRLCAYIDEKASVYEVPGTYTIYHLALENEDYYGNYGIYANGLLVESCSKRYLLEHSNMELIE